MNTDLDLITRFLAGDRKPTSIDSNPLAQLLSGQLLEVDTKGIVSLSFEPPVTFVQGAGVLQGGAVATMLDFAMAFAALAALPAGRTCATASFTTNLLKPAPPGKYIARGTVDRMGSQVAFVSAVLQRADNNQTMNQTVATASSVMPVVQLK